MPSFIYPAAQRPSTAVAGLGDQHDDNVYSAIVVAHGGVGTQKAFVAGQGSPIPALTGTAIPVANVPNTYVNYTPLTTVIEQSGQLGNSIGDAEIRAIGVTFDLAAYSYAAATPRVFGATPFEIADVLGKCRMEVKVSNKRRIQGPVWSYPNLGGMAGGLATTANAATIGAVNNGPFPTGRRLKSPILIARNDVLVAEFTADAALAFSDTSFATTHAGQATLVWINLIGTLRSDVR
jgi:hypothetical protein